MDHPETLPPSPATAAGSAGVGEQVAFLALSSIRGVGYWTLAHMAKAGVGFADFLATDDREEASARLRSFGARLERKAAGAERFKAGVSL
jgi:hypothetical protein